MPSSSKPCQACGKPLSSGISAGFATYGNANTPDSAFVSNIFLNNATRISTTKLFYGIPLVFPDTGTLYIRVRSVQLKSDGSALASNWSSMTLPNGLGKYYFYGHQLNINWQSSVTFAEEGKRKVVVQYYDGSLRSRQTVTKDNSVNIIDVAETFYDYQGRPVIQVLPVPTLSSAIKYTQLFNVANTGEYDKSVYDKLTSPDLYCDSSAPAMSTSSGASNYYSSSNGSISGIERFIPDAQGYPFTQTQYTQDNTGRIAKQSGVGPVFKIGSGQETIYYYGSPDQDELDALFGTEVGDRSHYFKNAVQDANGQFSVSYVDMHGRTIATALSGGNPPGMDTISSFLRKTEITETLSDPTSTIINDLVMESHKSLLVTSQGIDTFTFNYDLNPQSFVNKDCQQADICYNCLYDLEITITDDCNNQKLPSGQPFKQTVYKGSLAALNDTCNKTSAGMHVNFSLPLAAGTYEITKKLSVSKYAEDFYRTNVFTAKNICNTLDTFVERARLLLSTQCTPSYRACRDSLGSFSDFYTRYIVKTGVDTLSDTTGLWKEIWKTYQDGLNACYELGDTALTVDDDIRREMLLDVSAPGGQYANPDSTQDVYSIFHAAAGSTYLRYQKPGIVYLDDFGNPDHVINDLTGRLVTPDSLDVIQFARKFKSSWANALLPYHPEYCKLQLLDTYNSSLAWNKDFEKTDNYQVALNKGYLTPLGSSMDPIAGAARTKLQNLFNAYLTQGTSLSMTQAAILPVYCVSGDTSCISSFFTTPKGYADLSCDPARDMAWRNFREIYLSTKKRIIDSLISKGGCTPGSQSLISAYRMPHFYSVDTAVSLSNLSFFNNTNNSLTVLTDSIKSRMDSAYTQNCRSYTTLWLQQLQSCANYPLDSINKVIIPRLIQVCKEGSNTTHPYGSREISPDSALVEGKYSSFDDVINDYNLTHGIARNEFCNADLITYPELYDKQSTSTKAPAIVYTKPDDCTCEKINLLHTEFTIYSSGFTNFSDYLYKRYNTSISQNNLDSLMGLCNNTSSCKYVSTPIAIPAVLQCNSASTCATCSSFQEVYNAFTSLYRFTPTRTETDTTQQRRNSLFTSYMNAHLGFAKQTWEYLDFKDRCNSTAPVANIGTSNKCVDCDSLQVLINAYFNQSGIYGGSETAMLLYIKDALANNGLNTTTDNIKSALSVCHIGWEKNVAFGGTTVAPGAYYVFKDSTSNMNIGSNGNPFTIECWANFGNDNLEQPLLYNINAKNSTYFGTQFTCTDNKNGYYIYEATENSKKYLFARISDTHSDTSSYYIVRSTDTLVPLKWYHIVLTRSGNSVSGFKMYLNGQLTGNVLVRGSGNLQNGNITPLSPLANGKYIKGLFLLYNSYIGGGANSTAYLKNLRLYGRTLAQNEISSNYTNCDGIPYDTTSLKLWAKLVEAGNRPKDYSLYNTPGYWLTRALSSCDTTGNLYSKDSVGRWKGQRGTVALDSCIPALTSVLCNYPDDILLCGNTTPYIADVNQITNCSDSAFFAFSAGMERYNDYSDSLNNYFDSVYRSKCLQAFKYELFTVTHKSSEYHYTLYYYDQAGNLVKTVPPHGVIPNRNSTWLQQVKTARAAGTVQVPVYQLTTEYKYNSLNQVIAQITPDGGKSSFYYDRLGRLVVSQNAKQITASNYSYTKYDLLGRITEVGQIHSTTSMSRTLSKTQSQLDTWFNNANSSRTEITQTHYDSTYYVSLAPYLSATDLRNRVAWTALYNTAGSIDSLNHATATFYSYDIHGNVDTLLQDFKSGIMATSGNNRFKKIVYQYDLISGKVNQVAYQPGQQDAFYHRYTYDAENRLTDVETSADQLYWEHDAFYKYYKHGPLARMVIGDQQVQGVDYAYTLQGWLKGVNSTSLSPTDDMGSDGKTTGGTSSPVGRDAFGFALQYYGRTDYTPISNARKMFADGYDTLASFNPLYNGNIAAISLNIQYPALASGIAYTGGLFYNYKYDQLNRLTKLNAFNGLNTSTNTWNLSSIQDDYKENISYDPNGNIIGYLRNGTQVGGTPRAMDSLNYRYYYTKTNGALGTYNPSALPTDAAKLTNQLAYITDSVRTTNYTVDIDNQAVNNYSYDSIGNLTKDIKENIDSIYWTVYGKIAQINKHDGTVIKYTYDVSGNRISKVIGTKQTWYVRDASGNVMSLYTSGDTINAGHLTQSEVDIYGSNRLGLLKPNIDVTLNATMPGAGSKYFTTFIRGKKFFELTNHLDNVLVTVTDKKLGIRSTNDTTKYSYYIADIVSVNDFYPFGMVMPGRSYSCGTLYRYGFNGKENDNEVKGTGNQQDYGMRIYDPRVGKFLSVDPISNEYPELTPYQFASNRPVDGIDLDGLEYSQSNKYGALESTSTKLYPMHPIVMQQTNAKIQKEQEQRRVPILAGDLYGNGHIGPKWLVQANIASIRQKHMEAVGDNIAGGPFGAIGYIWKGDRGSFVGAAVDQIIFSFGGVPGESGYLSKPKNLAPEISVPYNETPAISQARQLLYRALRIQGLKSPPESFKQQWTEEGYDYEVRIHPQDPNAPAGSNSATYSTFRISRRLQGTDANGQGYGWEYLDEKGNWFKNKDLKANKNPEASNDTHIPVKKK